MGKTLAARAFHRALWLTGVLTLVIAVPVPQSAAAAVPVGGGVYTLASGSSGKCPAPGLMEASKPGR
ncbi:hypothetical protein [Actinoplanes sp. NBRC 101535]|uniref:hypothetical protein n=1 Tax=Actinoplanes sp. NBRC 101535 TaxID=3032196 RepID=UPI0024A00320|nr:hypothetical protein [Actinoplanes sp. NBRC 101535]GLY07869.1 hypothetical protein Acsp01_82480 [Actinoplanes sp. NBRC 101535]